MKNLMPKLTMLLVALVLPLFALPAFAAEVNLMGMYSLYKNENLESGRGLKLSVDSLWSSHEEKSSHNTGVYPWASHEETLLRFGGQEMADIKILGGGFGIQKKGWFVELGYYWPRVNLRTSHKEALWLEMNKVVQPSLDPASYHGNGFEYKISGDFGVSLGTKSEYQIWTDGLHFTFSVVYRWLRFEDVVTCRFPDGGYWEVYDYRDFSGVLACVGFKYEWQ